MSHETTHTKADRPSPFFIGDHVALDFLNSRCEPGTIEFDWLLDGDDLIKWMQSAGLLTADEAIYFEGKFDQIALNTVAEQARDLREWFRTFIEADNSAHTAQSETTDSNLLSELSLLNDILSKPVTQSHAVSLSREERTPKHRMAALTNTWVIQNASDALFPIARAIADFLVETDPNLVKNCEGPTCTMWFYDTTKNHRRRWCVMDVCGNRAKAAAFRARKKKANI